MECFRRACSLGASFVEEELITQTYGNRRFDRDKYLAAYRLHHNDVINYFNNGELVSSQDKNRKFLVIDLDKGEMNYKNICEFLELPVREGRILKSNEPQDVTMIQRAAYQIKRNVPFILDGYHYIKDRFSKFLL